MKNILVRAHMHPLLNYSAKDVLANNLIGSNMGNMLFPYSVVRTVMGEEVNIKSIITSRSYSAKQIDKINQKYDCLLMPFANAFRKSFMEDLQKTTELIKKLKIPCIVVGVGAQAALNKEITNYELDEAVKEFMAAVLEKSSIVGLRGEFTAKYLEGLGFRAEKDFTVIGCPSMYLWGDTVPLREIKELTVNSDISYNSKISLPQKYHNFLDRNVKQFERRHYVPQVIQEIRTMYYNKALPKDFSKKKPKLFPLTGEAEVYKSGKAVAFVNAKSWLDYLSKKDFSFGNRIHGNIASLLAGTPCYIIASDERVKELVSYHNIPHTLLSDVNKKTNILDLFQSADYSLINKGHKQKFEHYLDFLRNNGVETVYDNGKTTNSVFDNIVSNTPYSVGLTPYASLPESEQKKRVRDLSFINDLYSHGKIHMIRNRF